MTSHLTAVDLSVIIPIYNVDEYLTSCLDSIANQCFNGRLEVILVNDKSPDNCEEICLKYLSLFPEIFKYLKHDKNVGVSASRNSGLSVAKGKYFTFVDPDDFVAKEGLNKLYNAAIEFNADIVKGNNCIFRNGHNYPVRNNVKATMHFYGEKVLEMYFEHKFIRGYTWGKIYKSEKFLAVLNPVKYRMAEDLFYNAEVFSMAENIACIPDLVYHYRHRTESASKQKLKGSLYLDWLDSVNNSKRFCRTKKQNTKHTQLQIRSLLEFVRECRSTPLKEQFSYREEAIKREKEWNLSLKNLILVERVSLASLFRFLKYKYTVLTLKTNQL